MNRFPLKLVIAACDAYLLIGNTISERQRVNNVVLLKSYASCLLASGQDDVLLTIDEFAPISEQFLKLVTAPR